MIRRFFARLYHWMALLGLAMKDDDPIEVRDPDRQWGPACNGLSLSAKARGKRLSVVLKNAGFAEIREQIPAWLFFYRLNFSGPHLLTTFGKHTLDPKRNERRTELVLSPGKSIEAEIPVDSLYKLPPGDHRVTVSAELAGCKLVSNEVTISS